MKIAAGARGRVAQEILRRGPVTAADLADRLDMTTAGVRRHLDLLEAEGLVVPWQGPVGRPRGRGRPARAFVLTDAGHAAMRSEYDALAEQALRFLAEAAGPQAVREFADRRAADLARRHRDRVEAAGQDPARRARALADGLTEDGYAAGTRPVGELGVQLCQGHCPVQGVARSFPELCEAETEMFSQLVGVHVQRLATLAHGEHVCTTYIPRDGGAVVPGGPDPAGDGPGTEQTDRSGRSTPRSPTPQTRTTSTTSATGTTSTTSTTIRDHERQSR